MRISEISRLTGVSVRSLRHYEQKNLIASKRLENGYRDFGEEVVEQVKTVQLYLALGLTTDDIEKIVHCKEQQTWASAHVCDGLLQLYDQKLQEIDRGIKILSEVKGRILQRISWMEEVRSQQRSENVQEGDTVLL